MKLNMNECRARERGIDLDGIEATDQMQGITREGDEKGGIVERKGGFEKIESGFDGGELLELTERR